LCRTATKEQTMTGMNVWYVSVNRNLCKIVFVLIVGMATISKAMV